MCSIFLFVAAGGLSAQHPASDAYVLKNWNVPEGLPQSSVKEILQTRDGYLWIGTWNGLARFDGIRFTNFHTGNTPAMSSSIISALFQDKAGSLWIGMDGGGLVHYRNGVFTKINAPFSVVSGFAEDASERLWVATDIGLFTEDGDRFSPVIGKDEIFNRRTRRIHFDQNHDLWFDVGTTLVHAVLDEATPEIKATYPIDSSGFTLDSFGRIWYFNDRNQLIVRDGNTTITMSHIHGKDVSRIWPIRNGGIGICYLDRIVLIQDKDVTTIQHITDKALLTNEVLFEDREGNIWLGRASSGLYRLRKRTVQVNGRVQGLTSEVVTSLAEDHDGVIWAGTYRNGLNYLKNGRFHPYIDDHMSRHEDILSVISRRDSSIVVASRVGGITMIKKNRSVAYVRGFVRPDVTIQVLMEDKDGGLWIGSREYGLQYDDGRQLKIWNTSSGLSSNTISSILQTQNGDTWVGTPFSGLNRIRDGVVTQFTTEDGLTSNEIMSLTESDGVLWISTRRGLNRWKEDRFAQITAQNGLAVEAIAMSLNDGMGNLWFGGIQGIMRVDASHLNAVADGAEPFVQGDLFGVEDGMSVSEVGGQGMPNLIKDRENRIWFTSERGMMSIDLQQLQPHPFTTEVIIEEILVENQPVSMDTTIILKPGQSMIEIRYTGIRYLAPTNIRFQYKMDGLEDQWLDAGNQRTVRYTNLTPGTYTFNVRAQNSVPATLSFTVLAPFYETWWFRSSIVLLISGLGVGFYRYRMANLQKLLHMRLQIANDLHDEIGSNLSSVILKSRMLEAKDRSSHAYVKGLRDIQSISQKTAQAMRDIIWLINPEHDVVEDLVQQLNEIANSMLVGIETEIQTNLHFETATMNLAVRRNVTLIFKEILHNIVKHAEATKVTISFHRNESGYQLLVRDNGKGFDVAASNRSTHYGLKSLSDRASSIQGTLKIHSEPGKGASVSLHFKNYGSS